MENWKDIQGYEGHYQVSDLGRVKSLKRWVNNKVNGGYFLEEKLANQSIGNRYLEVSLSKDGKTKTFRVHQLVAMAFLNHKPCGYKLVVDHKDNNPLNNKLSNIQVVSARENTSKDRSGYSSKYVGVNFDLKNNKWRAAIFIDKKVKYLGLFDNEERASIAYQFALVQLDELKKTMIY